MEERIKHELNGNYLDISLCEKKGLRAFEPFLFRKIEGLDADAFGSVKKCLYIKDRSMVAVKTFKINGVEDYEGQICVFLVEIEILKRINESSHPNLTKLIGGYYIADSMGMIKSLILVTEAWDFSLKQLIDCRLKSRSEDEKKSKKAPYEPEEVIGYLKYLVPAYQELRKLNIYHSDTKLQNIVYSHERRGFIIKHFGVSNVIRGNLSKGVEISKYVRGGTPGYNSPEKQFYFDIQENIKEDQDCFDPFKCDMWALGVCIEKMAGTIQMTCPGASFLKTIIAKLKESNWKERFDVEDLAVMLKSQKTKEINFNMLEKKFFEKLEDERRSNFSEMIDLFQKAHMPVEELKMAKKERENLEKVVGKLNDENSLYYEPNLKHLCDIPK